MKNKVKSFKIFESIMIWLLSLCLIFKLTLVFKILDVKHKVKGILTNQSDFVTILNNFAAKTEDLKALKTLMLLYRTFFLLLLGVFLAFVIYRLITKQYYKLLKINTVMVLISIIIGVYYIYLTKDSSKIFQSVIYGDYLKGFNEIIYLLGRVEYFREIKNVLLALLIITPIFNLLAIILNIRSLIGKEDEARFMKVAVSLLILTIVMISSLVSYNLYNNFKNKQFNPFDYMLINYVHDEKGIHIIGSPNMRKVNAKTLDPAFRNIYSSEIFYEIDNYDKELEVGDIKEVNVKYNKETVELLNLKIGKLKNSFKINFVPKIVKNIEDIDINSLYKYLSKYDMRYLIKSNKNDENIGIYVSKFNNETKYYVLQNINYNQLSLEEVATLGEVSETVYKLIYLGTIYENNKKVVGLEALNNRNATILFSSLEDMKKVLKENKIEKVK